MHTLEKKLKLKVNPKKSKVERATRAEFLGFSFWKRKGEVFIRLAKRTKERFTEKIRRLTKRTRSGKMEDIVSEVNRYTRGWIGYFRLATTSSVYQGLDEWIRRRLRQIQWKRWKRGTTRYRELVRLGVSKERAALGAGGTSPWRMSHSPIIHEALSNAFWRNTGLESITDTTSYAILIEPPAKRADPHVRWCEGERLAAAPYSISLLDPVVDVIEDFVAHVED